MITRVLRRYSLPSRHSLSAALPSFDSEVDLLSYNLISRSISSLFFNISSEPSIAFPARIAFQGYATKRESKKGEERHVKDQRNGDLRRDPIIRQPGEASLVSLTLYTVLRFPHVDKKSREQFEMRFKKRFLVIKAQSHELSKKLFWLKRYRILGAQYELRFHRKTRLDVAPVLGNISGSTIGL